MQRIEHEGIVFLAFTNLMPPPPLRHGISLRYQDFGEMDFATAGSPAVWQENVQRFSRAVGLGDHAVVRAEQVHGSQVAAVDGSIDLMPGVDGLCTNTPGISLVLLGADCPLLLVYDPRGRAIGIAHAGWRGTVGRIAAKLVDTMAQEFASNPTDLRAGIGPGICANCYEVTAEVVERMRANLAEPDRFIKQSANDSEHWHVDLAQASKAQLIEAGLGENNIETSNHCTFEHGQDFPSYRRDGKSAGRLALIAGLST